VTEADDGAYVPRRFEAHLQRVASVGPNEVATIAHGFLTLSMIPTFLPEIFDLSGYSMAINYGLDRVRFISPVPVGSRLRATAEIADVQELADAFQLKFLVAIEAENAEKPNCVATFIARQYL
jgi:acyl dehydratase